MRADGFHRAIVSRPKGRPTTGELDAGTAPTGHGGTPKARVRRRHYPFEGRPGVLRGRTRPQPVKFWLAAARQAYSARDVSGVSLPRTAGRRLAGPVRGCSGPGR